MNFEQIKPDYTSTHFQVLEETVQKNVQTAAENKPTGFVAADHRNLKLAAWLLLIVGGFCSVFSAITFVSAILYHSLTGSDITASTVTSPIFLACVVVGLLLLAGFEVVKDILVKQVSNTKLYNGRISTLPMLILIAVVSFSAFTSIKGGSELALIATNTKAASMDYANIEKTRETYTKDIDQTRKDLDKLTSKKGMTWAGKLTPSGQKEYEKLQNRINYLTEQRDLAAAHDENQNQTTKNEVLSQGATYSTYMGVFAFVIELLIISCGIYLSWFYFKVNTQHNNTAINKTHAVSGAKEHTQVIEAVSKIDNTVITGTDIDSLLQRLAAVERNLKTAQSQARQIEEGVLKDRNIETVQSRIDRLEAERKELKAQIQGHSAKDYH